MKGLIKGWEWAHKRDGTPLGRLYRAALLEGTQLVHRYEIVDGEKKSVLLTRRLPPRNDIIHKYKGMW